MRLTTSKIINDVAKVQIKSEKITPFGGIFHVRELFSRFVNHDWTILHTVLEIKEILTKLLKRLCRFAENAYLCTLFINKVYEYD